MLYEAGSVIFLDVNGSVATGCSTWYMASWNIFFLSCGGVCLSSVTGFGATDERAKSGYTGGDIESRTERATATATLRAASRGGVRQCGLIFGDFCSLR